MLALRIRPFNDMELAIKERHKPSYELDSSGRIISFGKGKVATHFHFDKILDQGTTQEDVAKLLPYSKNVCVIAYGQTGSGKTHTMTGNIWKSGGLLWAYF